MIVFEDQDNDYEVERLKKTNVVTKIRIVVLLVVFVVVVSAFAKNDYDFDFSGLGSGEKINFECEKETMNSTVDDLDERLQGATKALSDNMETVSGFRGYVASSANIKPIGFKKMPIPVVTIILNQVTNEKYPEKMCGYSLEVIYQ